MEAKRDENRITTLLAVLNTDGTTPNLICADPVAHTLCVNTGDTGTDFDGPEAARDENRVPVALAVSSDDDETPVELYSDSLYQLLIQSS